MQPKLDGEKCWWQHWAAVGQYDVELPHWAGAASAPAAAAPPTMDVRHTESHTRIIAGRCDMEAGMAKYFATETGVFCSQEAMRIFGGYSYSTEYEIERYYRDAMLMCIGEGTNEMQRIIIAKQLIDRNKI